MAARKKVVKKKVVKKKAAKVPTVENSPAVETCGEFNAAK